MIDPLNINDTLTTEARVKKLEIQMEEISQKLKALGVALGINIQVSGNQISFNVPLIEQNKGVIAAIFREMAEIKNDMKGGPRILRPN